MFPELRPQSNQSQRLDFPDIVIAQKEARLRVQHDNAPSLCKWKELFPESDPWERGGGGAGGLLVCL